MRTLYVPLPEDALARLDDLARREFREPKAQAAQFIVDGLRRAELPPDPSAARSQKAAR
jgi:hypothetical protein